MNETLDKRTHIAHYAAPSSSLNGNGCCLIISDENDDGLAEDVRLIEGMMKRREREKLTRCCGDRSAFF